MGYLLVGTSLFTFVHPSQVYPDLIFLRLFFAFGGSACVAMVTAILPKIKPYSHASATPTNGKIAGLAGFCTGVGALIAVIVFLPLPGLFISHGWQWKESVRASFYVVGTVALGISIVLFFGLKKDHTKGFANLFRKSHNENSKSYFKLMGEGFLAARD